MPREIKDKCWLRYLERDTRHVSIRLFAQEEEEDKQKYIYIYTSIYTTTWIRDMDNINLQRGGDVEAES